MGYACSNQYCCVIAPALTSTFQDGIAPTRVSTVSCPTTVMVASIAGAVVNIALNVWLIPVMGGLGAALASVVAYGVSGYAWCFVDKRSKDMGLMMTKALLMPWRST